MNVVKNCEIVSTTDSYLEELAHKVKICRKELKNLRESMHNLKRIQQKEVKIMKELIEEALIPSVPKLQNPANEKLVLPLSPIGYIKSPFKAKNGIPHQSSICPLSRSQLKIEKSVFTNPHHSLIGLEQYSHIWIIFLFHKNHQDGHNKKFTKAKIQPPRLNGKTVGVFASRSPHRPNPVGLTLTCLEKIEGETLYLCGVDLLDGTPVVDIKPYIPDYDMPKNLLTENKSENLRMEEVQCEDSMIWKQDRSDDSMINHDKIKTEFTSDTLKRNLQGPSSSTKINVASWIAHPVISKLTVAFSNRAETDLKKFHKKGSHGEECAYCLEFLCGPKECVQIIDELLQTDPRSIYRRKKCYDKLYYFTVDKMHVTAWFDDSENITEVLRVIPVESKIS